MGFFIFICIAIGVFSFIYSFISVLSMAEQNEYLEKKREKEVKKKEEYDHL